MRRFHHDFETYSEVDLKKVGSDAYARHESTDVLMLGYASDDEPVKQWIPAYGEDMPAEVEDAILDDRVLKFAWNKPFEWSIWKHCLGYDTPHTSWRDPMVLALSCSFPGKLLKCAEVLNLPEELRKTDGTRLINWFSKKRPATKKLPERRVYWFEKPELWNQYLYYNRLDVESERKIYRLLRRFDLPQWEWDLYALDQEINQRGIPVDIEMAENAIKIRNEYTARLLDEMSDIMGGGNPNSNDQLLAWLRENGYPFDDLKAGPIRRAKEREYRSNSIRSHA